MKKINKKKFLLLSKMIMLFFIVLFCMLPLMNTNTIVSSIAKLFKADNEVELDNWEISTVFYDSTVNDGKTPLTEINWDASDGGYNGGNARVISIQINYKNTNSITTYYPGDLKIKYNNIFYRQGGTLGSSVVAGANYRSNTGFDWTLKSIDSEYFEFENAITFNEKTNFEGTIMIQYTLTPSYVLPQKYENVIERSLNKEIITTLNNDLQSNPLIFNYHRTYEYQWEKANYTIQKEAKVLNSVDYLPNPNNYYWVQYDFIVKDGFYNPPSDHNTIILEKDLYLIDKFPSDIIAFDGNHNKLEFVDNNIKITANLMEQKNHNTYDRFSYSIVAGYPKESYSSSSAIENEVNLYVQYGNSDEYEYVDNDKISLDLVNYNYNLGNLYNFYKSPETTTKSKERVHFSSDKYLYYENLRGNYNIGCKGELKTELAPYVKYSGYNYDLKIADDFIYVTDENNNYRLLSEDEYYFNSIQFPAVIYDGNDRVIPKNRYDVSLYIKKKGNNNYILLENFKNTDVEADQKKWSFDKEDGIISFYFIIHDVYSSIFIENHDYYIAPYEYIKSTFKLNELSNVHDETGILINNAYMEVISDNNILNSASSQDYPEYFNQTNIMSKDLEEYGDYKQRWAAAFEYKKYEVEKPRQSVTVNYDNLFYSAKEDLEQYQGSIRFIIDYDNVDNQYNEWEFDNLHELIDKKYWNDGYEVYNLLPLGMNLSSSVDEIVDSISMNSYNVCDRKAKSGLKIDADPRNYFKNRTRVSITPNWNNTNRTMIKLVLDFSEDPLLIYHTTRFSGGGEEISYKYNWYIDYDSIMELGNHYYDVFRLKYLNKKVPNDINYTYYRTVYPDNGAINNNEYDHDAEDINRDLDKDESFSVSVTSINLPSVKSTHQDVQVSVQSDKSNYDTGKVDTSNDSEYFYKLRARTGSNDITNLVIYDSLEKYAKDPNMESVLASGGRRFWQGEFLGIDTSYAESKGYTVKTYYSENEQVESLKDDDSWKLYTDSVDKSKVKSLAFEYLDGEGNPAVLSSNSLTYVLIKMKSPADENIKTLAYNGCWTEWNAIDPITGDQVDFITGINSNIVKVALPNSVEPVDIDFDVHKYWKDNSNELGIRPNNITIQVVPDGDVSKAIDVPLGSANVDSNNSNHWYTTIQVPKYDDDGNTIAYTVREDEIRLSNGYKYTPEIEDNSITNKLVKEITLKKRWIDNTNSYLTRPGNVTFNLKRNGNSFKQVTITGDYSSNEWTQTTTVDVYDSSNNKYEYSIDEVNVNNYSSNCEGFTCTNKLTGKETINVSKEWNDNNNSYNTRPNDITIKLLQNGNQYKNIVLNGNNNWNSDVEVDKYDSNGREYTYTVSEEELDEYGLVTYDQNNYKITNTLKTNMNIVVTKNWIDDDNSNNTRPSELVVTLLRDGEDYREIILSGDGNTWTTSIEVPKYDDNQKEYKYSIKEVNDNINDDYSDITYEDDLTITNKLSKKIDLTIKKKWVDQSNEFSSRPSEVNIELLRDGELFKTLTLNGNSDTWESVVKDVDVYDDNGKKYNYTIREDNIEKYEKVTYDQTNLEVTNELTDIPKVTLYFTVVNGYVDPKTGKMKYDEFGLNEILKKYNKTLEDEYIFKFKLENTDTHKTYDGKLSTKGILEFKDIPYGDYKAVVGKDKLFEFVDMLSIKEVNGVSFKKIGKEGYISIKPTGENIIFGAKIINRIVPPINNPKTGLSWLILLVFILPIVSLFLVKNKKEY